MLQGASADASSAPVGVNPKCGIPRLAHGSALGNIANTIVAGLSVFLVLYMVQRVGRRKAAVGAFELFFSGTGWAALTVLLCGFLLLRYTRCLTPC